MFMPRALAGIVERVARQSVGKDWNLYAALLEHWPEIVGQEYAATTSPVKMNFPHQPNEPRKGNGVLTVRLPKGLAMEFSFKSEQIRQRVNSYFGYNVIAKIIFDTTFVLPPKTSLVNDGDPVALKAVRESASTVESDELRAALESFGTAVIKGRPPI